MRVLLGAESSFEGAGAAGFQAFVGGAFELDILDTSLLAELALGRAAAFGVDDEDVGLHDIEGGNEIDDSTTLIDIGLLDSLDIFYHKQTFLLGEHGFTVLIFQVGGIGTDAYVQVTKL